MTDETEGSLPKRHYVISVLLMALMLGIMHLQLELVPSNMASEGPYVGPLIPGQLGVGPPQITAVVDDSHEKFENPGLVNQATPPASGMVTPAQDLNPPKVDESWRLGFGMAIKTDADQWGSQLLAGWYLSWRVAERTSQQQMEHWQMVRVSTHGSKPTSEQAANVAQRYPGGTWIIGNEPDVIWQDNVTPERYAQVYHELYVAIKRSDPSAQIAVAGISQATPLRLQYLDRVLEAYQAAFGAPMPVDTWTVHGFVLREERDSWGVEIPPGMDVDHGELYEVSDHARLDLFEGQLRAFRAWMAERGYRDRPLALTEFGILMPFDYGFPEELVIAYLEQTFEMLLRLVDDQTGYPADGNRLVQRWAWYSLADSVYPTGNLVDLANTRLTSVGEAFRKLAERHRP